MASSPEPTVLIEVDTINIIDRVVTRRRAVCCFCSLLLGCFRAVMDSFCGWRPKLLFGAKQWSADGKMVRWKMALFYSIMLVAPQWSEFWIIANWSGEMTLETLFLHTSKEGKASTSLTPLLPASRSSSFTRSLLMMDQFPLCLCLAPAPPVVICSMHLTLYILNALCRSQQDLNCY